MKIINKSEIGKWIMILLAIAFCFMAMLYEDNILIMDFSYGITKGIFEGNLIEYYNSFNWEYGLTIYIIYAVWGIPVWILNRLLGISDLMTIPTLLWFKLLIALFAVWSVYLVGKIADCLYEDKKRDIQLQYVCSSLFVAIVFAVVQCDIITICFVLLGLLAYMKRENKKFVFYFTIAITMKYLALFVFVPLVLYRYKQIIKIIVSLAISISLSVLSAIIISGSDAVKISKLDDGYLINRQLLAFADTNLKLGNHMVIGVLALFWVILCIYAYFKVDSDEMQMKKYALWFTLAGYSCFFMCYLASEYWFVLLVPFIILISYSDESRKKVNLILELVFSITVLVKYAYIQDYVYLGKDSFSHLLLKHYGLAVNENLIQLVLNSKFPLLFDFLPMVQGVMYACLIMILVINAPTSKFSVVENEKERKVDIEFIEWLRIAGVYAWIFIGLWGLMKSQAPYWYKGDAVIEMTDNGLYNYECQYSGDFYDDETGGVWIGEEFGIQMHLEDEVENNLLLTTYGYSTTSDAQVSVYVNTEYVGDLTREDESANITNRYIEIPKELIPSNGDVTITLQTTPQLTVTDNEGKDFQLGLYFENIYIKEAQ
jgi:hypothetical protein